MTFSLSPSQSLLQKQRRRQLPALGQESHQGAEASCPAATPATKPVDIDSSLQRVASPAMRPTDRDASLRRLASPPAAKPVDREARLRELSVLLEQQVKPGANEDL
jgi:hypothetical protein